MRFNAHKRSRLCRESRAQLRRLFYLFLQFIIDRRIHWLIVVLALPGEYLLLLVIHRHHIDLRIAVDTAISRAKKRVILYGDPQALDVAVQKNLPQRKSLLVPKTRMLLECA